MTDGIIPPDASNPWGYFEYEGVKNLPINYPKLQGKAVKVLNRYLLPMIKNAPEEQTFIIYYMMRPFEEIQKSLLLWRIAHDMKPDTTSADEMAKTFCLIHNQLKKIENVYVRFATFREVQFAYLRLA